MAVLVVLFASLALFAGLGALGVSALSAPQDVVAWALATMFLFTASAHFTKTKEDLVAMVPGAFPRPGLSVNVTESWRAWARWGSSSPRRRGLAGLCLVLLLVAIFPANVSAARRGVPMRGGRRPRCG